jgi:hypothetical protein
VFVDAGEAVGRQDGPRRRRVQREDDGGEHCGRFIGYEAPRSRQALAVTFRATLLSHAHATRARDFMLHCM